MKKRLLEVCAYNIQSCLVAQKAGAGRVELCASPAEGGVTPSYGTIQYAVQNTTIPIYVMIRPRGGDFVYDEHELRIMRQDIATCKELGVPGIAIGILRPDNTIDTEEMTRMVELASPMGVTCHKAFDRTPDAFAALESIIAAGCERVLTSGLEATAVAGAATLAQLVANAAGRIVIMPGGGVRSSNIGAVAADTHAMELHSSALVADSIGYVANADEVMLMVDRMNETT